MLPSALAIVAATLSVSFLCSMLEACVLSLSRAEVVAIGQRSARLGRIWKGFKERIEYPLAAILIVSTTTHTVGMSLAAGRLEVLYGERGVLVASAIVAGLMIQWTEVLPKTLGSHHRRRVAEL